MRTISTRLGVVGLLAALALTACSDDEKKPYSELLLFNDEHVLKAAAVSGGSVKQVGAAAIPGEPGTYAREGNLVTVTMPGHHLYTGFQAELAFSAGTGGTATSGVYPVTVVDASTFTVTDTASGAIADGEVLRRFVTTRAATYAQVSTTVTVTLAAHGLDEGDTVRLDYTSGAAVDGTYEIQTVVDEDTFTLTAAAAAETSGNVTVRVGVNYGIFGIAMHPSGKWAYTTSTYECWYGSPLCWGSGLVSRFGIDWKGKLTYQASFRVGRARPAPVGLTFSSDGALLFVQDDQLDGVDLWAVDATTGDLTLVDSSAQSDARLHGLAVNADATRVYNGDIVFSVDPTAGTEAITMIHDGRGSNSCFILDDVVYSVTAWSGWRLDAWSLTDPDVPTEITTTLTNTTNYAREIVVSPDGGLVVTAGFSGLKVYAFDGEAFTPAVGAGSTEYIDGFEAWTPDAVVQKVFRSLTVNGGGNLLAAAYFVHDDDGNTLGGLEPSGVMLFSLAADGSIAKVGDYSGATYARAARFVQKP